MTITNEALAAQVAHALLKVKAVSLSPDMPFTWASGLHSPIYCDNRITLSDHATRTLIASSMAKIITNQFPQTDLIAGTATAGIPHATLVAHHLELPMVYVRSKAKDHGKENQIEGKIGVGQNIVLIEDLISTGGSVLQAAKALEQNGGNVLAVLGIFSYELARGQKAFAEADIPLITLSNFPTIITVAAETGYIDPMQINTLSTWSNDPQAWSDAH